MAESEAREALDITVKGVVQGVGFRPFVFRCAQKFHLTGWVLNALDGVTIHVEGTQNDLDCFAIALVQEAPEAANVKELELNEAPVEGFDEFEIRFSDDAEANETTLVSPDLATCDACVAELFDPENRRYHYPFINCTNCGPRFTIIDELPYDREHTSMKEFTMDEPCQTEYDDPMDRRFHAQPNACFNCGPRLGWIDVEGMLPNEVQQLSIDSLDWAFTSEDSDEFVDDCVKLLKAGKIVAVKGLGGYHLVCDALNAEALAALRERKHPRKRRLRSWRTRPNKRAPMRSSAKRKRHSLNRAHARSCYCANAAMLSYHSILRATCPSWASCCPQRRCSI